MTRFLLIVLTLLLVGIGLGFLMYQDSGYVLISYSHWSVETSLWMAIIISILLFLLIYLSIQAFYFPLYLKRKFRQWSQEHRYQKVKTTTESGIAFLIEGELNKAEGNFQEALKYDQKSFIAYLSAAYTANCELAYGRRDNYLESAFKTNTNFKLSTEILKVKLLLDAGQWLRGERTFRTNFSNISEPSQNTPTIMQSVFKI